MPCTWDYLYVNPICVGYAINPIVVGLGKFVQAPKPNQTQTKPHQTPPNISTYILLVIPMPKPNQIMT